MLRAFAISDDLPVKRVASHDAQTRLTRTSTATVSKLQSDLSGIPMYWYAHLSIFLGYKHLLYIILPGDGQSVSGFSDHQSETLPQSKRMQCTWVHIACAQRPQPLQSLWRTVTHNIWQGPSPRSAVSNELLLPAFPGLKANSILSYWALGPSTPEMLGKSLCENRSAVEVTHLRGLSDALLRRGSLSGRKAHSVARE